MTSMESNSPFSDMWLITTFLLIFFVKNVNADTGPPYQCYDDFTLHANKTVDRNSVYYFSFPNETLDTCKEKCINETQGHDLCTGFIRTKNRTQCSLIFGRYKEQDDMSTRFTVYERSCNFNKIFAVEFFLQPKHEHKVIEQGYSVTLECDVYGADSAVVSIIFKSREVSNKPFYKIPYALEGNDGEYMCLVKRNTRDKNPLVKKLQLIIRYTPEFVNSNGSEAAQNTGESVNLTCNFRGLPKEVTWTKNKQPIPSGVSKIRHVVFHANSLVSDTIQIISKQWNIHGQYECKGINKYGQAVGTIQLKNSNCLGSNSDHNGSCIYGCVQGKYGSGCDINCTDGCSVCHPSSGHCLLKTSNVTDHKFTHNSCRAGQYGYDCSKNCSTNCMHGTSYGFKCEKFTGACIEPCADGYYGNYCSLSCGPCSSPFKNITSCDRETGVCDSCSSNCVESNCNTDGSCKGECVSGYSGTFCSLITSHGTKLNISYSSTLIIGVLIMLTV